MKLLSALTLIMGLFSLSLIHAEDLPGLHEPLKTVTKQYLAIQQKLTSDSFDGIPAAAKEMKTTMTAPNTKPFEPDFVQAVDALANAKDIHAARVAFQKVSDCFIAALAQNQVQTGSLHVAYCPMVKASWVQADGKAIRNPYYGTAMLECGEFKRQF